MAKRVIIINYNGMTGVAPAVSSGPLWVGAVSVDGETYLIHQDFMVKDPERRTERREDGSYKLKVAYHVTKRDISEARAIAYTISRRSTLSKIELALGHVHRIDVSKLLNWVLKE
jgi:hypothetical protein